ncbi:hypothetical protein BS50DRAFT_584296 [Corynespora cassiicola Philippines]|uniref:Extracellular membrane protein CFEM domain-containing protein n=1 Tax=Corynespora cassiicola Philippines TaxID=1448308 RepID=A0A2T2NZB0_CORCC|nr:hypothetical protein BS50DRAFT_584296 [Corynespora cassiicola Philippines]
MRFTLPLALGAFFKFGATKAIHDVVCDSTSTDRHTSVASLVETAGNCIQDICTTTSDEYPTTKHCGPLLLTINHLNDQPFDYEHCILGFQTILDQCITAEAINGGISQTQRAFYDISTARQERREEKDEPGFGKQGDISEEDESKEE